MLARIMFHKSRDSSVYFHHLLCAGMWHPLQSIFVHLFQHFLKKPQPSRSQRYFLQCLTNLVHNTHSCLSPHGELKSGFFPFFTRQLLPSFSLILLDILICFRIGICLLQHSELMMEIVVVRELVVLTRLEEAMSRLPFPVLSTEKWLRLENE